MIENLDGTVTLVTGAAGGIGKAICKSLFEAGATVIATDIKGQLPDSQKPDFISDWVDLDVREEAHWVEAMKIISKRYGRLDVLVNNAAVAPVVKLEEMSLEAWQRCQSINTNGIFLGLKYALPLLVESGKLRRGGASVINMSSAGGLVAAPFNAAYCTSKGAVRMLTKAAAVEFSALGYAIRVNSVHPGCIRTQMMEKIMQGFVDLEQAPSVDDVAEAMNAAHPIGRMGEADEIANSVLFLASQASSFMHGSELVVDGGYTSR